MADTPIHPRPDRAVRIEVPIENQTPPGKETFDVFAVRAEFRSPAGRRLRWRFHVSGLHLARGGRAACTEETYFLVSVRRGATGSVPLWFYVPGDSRPGKYVGIAVVAPANNVDKPVMGQLKTREFDINISRSDA